MKWIQSALFALLMWRQNREQAIYDDGYKHGWYNCLDAVQSGKMPVVLPRVQSPYSIPVPKQAPVLPPPVIDTDKQHTYPAYAPLERERITDRMQRPGQFGAAVHHELERGAGVNTAISRAIPKRPYSTVKLSPDNRR